MNRASRPRAALLAMLLVANAVAGPALAASSSADSTAAAPIHHEPVFGLDDLGVVLFTGVSLAILGKGDVERSQNVSSNRSSTKDDLSPFGEHFGNPVYSLPLLGVAYLAGHLGHKPGLSASALRITGGMVTAAGLGVGAKFVFGRWRPYESPDDAGRFDPFSSHSSFPSGHTTVAFSLAAGLDRETHAAWVPCVVYPAAAITAWSRVYEQKHWPTDVVAGAVLGIWASGKFDRLLRQSHGDRVSLEFMPMADPSTGALALGASLKF